MSSKLVATKWDPSSFSRSSYAHLDSTIENHILVKVYSSQLYKLPKDKFKHRRKIPPTDSHSGGRLEDMAPSVTSVPNDAGIQHTIPSVLRPDQVDPSLADFSHSNPAHTADNTFDIPRGTRDRGTMGDVTTGIGDQLPSNVERKNLDDARYDPRAKGHVQYAKHAKQRNDFDVMAGAGHDVEGAPGEDDVEQED
jgi:hypothetical protein